MKVMTDNEIVETLKLCTTQDGSIPCYDCPCWNDDEQECEGIDYTATLDLINRQKAEIEELKNYVNRCKSGKEYWVKCLLEKPNEALKEFAERIKMSIKANVVEALCNDVKGVYNAEYVIDDIDTLLKEMVGDKE